MTTIAVVGLGFVGLTTALGFCEKGYTVHGYDADLAKAAAIRQGTIPFHEPGLKEALNRHVNGSFIVVDALAPAVRSSDVIFFCVNTSRSDDGSVNLTHVLNAVEQTLDAIADGGFKVLVVKSTIPPGTTRDQIEPFVESHGFRIGEDIGIAANPEFLREGYAWQDFIHPDRIVIGTSDEQSTHLLEQVYSTFDAPLHKASTTSAEFIKYLSNTLLSTLISFSNEMAMLADQIGGIDVKQSFKILHQDRRWFGNPAGMTSYVYPGAGFGGYCLPKDTEAVYMQGKAKGYEAKGLRNVLEVNERVKDFVVEKVAQGTPASSTIGILGLSFKPNSDDIRDTPAKMIIERFLEKGYTKIVAYDPMATRSFGQAYGLPIRYADSLTELIDLADVYVLLTAWDEFKRNRNLLANRTIYDFRYCL
jgi:UDPglucose 6-dehydrogenase